MKYTPRVVTSQDAPVTTSFGSISTETVTSYPPEINPGAERVFPDPKVLKWKIAPPYNKSFKKVKQLREIKMTNYSVGEVREKWHLASINRTATQIGWPRIADCYQNSPRIQETVVPLSTYYVDNYDIIRAADSFPAVEYTDSPTPEDISSTLNDLKAKVVQDSYSGFDLLTELAEFPETLGMILTALKNARHPLKGIRELQERYKRARRRGKTHDEAHGEIQGQWMQYRYGIMPLVYSIQDAIKLIEQSFAEFKTDRTFAVLTSKPKRVPSSETHIAIYRAHEVKISVIGKAKFETQALRLSDLITTNLFVTAWELIPLSFVIDWFINVGDVIATSTSGMMDLAEERKFCYSIRRTTIDKHVLNYKFSDGGSRFGTDPGRGDPCNNGSPPLEIAYSNVRDNIGSALLYEREENSYERVVFQPNTVSLEFGPDLNWMRMLDGYVLSFNQVRKILKSLR